ncbi:hypothetical protein PoMZ_09412 [Pyricularia oryzae]|uniref:Uncharacterized protein n=1 Tax=Pyricularia oryzae TaxID=318829 RepID=A0A4P7MUH7_PYROR|nr:hypothetical protein PoMZ_09412 [Pyricularia oryzae]
MLLGRVGVNTGRQIQANNRVIDRDDQNLLLWHTVWQLLEVLKDLHQLGLCILWFCLLWGLGIPDAQKHSQDGAAAVPGRDNLGRDANAGTALPQARGDVVFHLGQLDALTPELDQRVLAADKVQRAVRAVPRQIPRHVHGAAPRRVALGAARQPGGGFDVRGGGPGRVAKVATAQRGALDGQLGRGADAGKPVGAAGLDEPHVRAVGPPDVVVPRGRGQERKGQRLRALGRPVDADDHLDLRRRPARHLGVLDGLAAHGEGAQARQRRGVQGFGHGRREVGVVAAQAVEGACDVVSAVRLGGDAQAAAADEGLQMVGPGHVKVVRDKVEDARAPADVQHVGLVGGRRGKVLVRGYDALGNACRAAGEDDVEHVCRGSFGETWVAIRGGFRNLRLASSSVLAEDKINFGPTCWTMDLSRASGWVESMARHAPPARITARAATGYHTDFSKHSGTVVPLPTPSASRRRASLRESASSSEYERLPSHAQTAQSSGWRRALMHAPRHGGRDPGVPPPDLGEVLRADEVDVPDACGAAAAELAQDVLELGGEAGHLRGGDHARVEAELDVDLAAARQLAHDHDGVGVEVIEPVAAGEGFGRGRKGPVGAARRVLGAAGGLHHEQRVEAAGLLGGPAQAADVEHLGVLVRDHGDGLALQLVQQLLQAGCRVEPDAHGHRVDQRRDHAADAGERALAARDHGAKDDVVGVGVAGGEDRPGGSYYCGCCGIPLGPREPANVPLYGAVGPGSIVRAGQGWKRHGFRLGKLPTPKVSRLLLVGVHHVLLDKGLKRGKGALVVGSRVGPCHLVEQQIHRVAVVDGVMLGQDATRPLFVLHERQASQPVSEPHAPLAVAAQARLDGLVRVPLQGLVDLHLHQALAREVYDSVPQDGRGGAAHVLPGLPQTAGVGAGPEAQEEPRNVGRALGLGRHGQEGLLHPRARKGVLDLGGLDPALTCQDGKRGVLGGLEQRKGRDGDVLEVAVLLS